MVCTLCENYLVLLILVGRSGQVVALDTDENDDELTTTNGAWVNAAIIVGLSGGLLLLLFVLLKVGSSMLLFRWFPEYCVC